MGPRDTKAGEVVNERGFKDSVSGAKIMYEEREAAAN